MNKNICMLIERGYDLRELAKSIKILADEAWDAASAGRATLDDLEAEYQRGRAHAFCEVLGDQAVLGRLGVFDD